MSSKNKTPKPNSNGIPNNININNNNNNISLNLHDDRFDDSLGQDDVDGIKALLSTGDAQLDLADLGDDFHDAAHVFGNGPDDGSLSWKSSMLNMGYDDGQRFTRNIPTLGQMADQIQAKARAEGRVPPSTGEPEEEIDEEEDDLEGIAFVGAGQEHTGRWTKEEHELFLKALEKYGKEWKKVASMVKTRTVVQTRTHAQKYFQKKLKSGENLGGFDYTSLDPSPTTTPKISPMAGNPNLPSQSVNSSGGNTNSGQITIGSDHSSTKRPSGLSVTIPPTKKPRRLGEDHGVEDHGPILVLPPSANASSIHMMQQQQHPHMSLLSNQVQHQRSHHTTPHYQSSNQMPTNNQSMGHSMFDNNLSLSIGHNNNNVTPPTGWNANNSWIPPAPPDQFIPQPSPAATGRRKHAELAVAATLAASATQDLDQHASSSSSSSNGNSAPSSAIKSDQHSNDNIDSSNTLNPHPGSSISMKGRKTALAIINPDLIDHKTTSKVITVSSDHPNQSTSSSNVPIMTPLSSNIPSTPWETDVQHLSFPNHSLSTTPMSTVGNPSSSLMNSVHSSGSNGQAHHYSNSSSYANHILTSNEKEFLEKLKISLFQGKEGACIELMDAFMSTLQTGFHDNKSTPTSASNQLSMTTPTSAISSTNNTPSERSHGPIIKPLAYLLNRSVDNPSNIPLLIELCEKSDITDQALYKSLVMILVERGASVHMINPLNGQSCLHITASKGFDQVGRYILNKGCQINQQDSQGNTAAHLASKSGHIHYVEMLLELGAHCHVHNHNALSALDVAGIDCQDKKSKRAELRARMFTIESRLRTLILYHDDCLTHTSQRVSDWEAPDRLTSIMERLRSPQLFPYHEIEISSSFERATVDLLSRVHSSDYITFVNNLSHNLQQQTQQNGIMEMPFTPQVQKILYHQSGNELKQSEYSDTTFSLGTLQAARRAAGSVAHAVDCVLLGRNRNAFCCVRPPGHHAGYRGLLDGNARSCGFCIFNSVAAGALHALEVRHCQRVAIVDLDIHHGNGTEDIVKRFHEPSRLFFFSLHLHDKDPTKGYEFFPGSGTTDDYVHNIINVPIMPLWKDRDSKFSPSNASTASGQSSATFPANILVGREGYRQAISQRLLPSLRAFNPSLILLSMGFDAAQDDIGNQRTLAGVTERGMDLLPEDFAWATTEIMRVADLCCYGRLVSVLEGGYGCIASAPVSKPRTRGSNVKSENEKSTTSSTTTSSTASTSSSSSSSETTNVPYMNRQTLANGAVMHVRRLVDAYEDSLT